ncbi:hypothetical protein FO519_000953 [Halicephalobus sp. NKZ332]|nr:hypothetical protein FO519_000953 [Halicephalobus sp. NKZ332]
MVLPTPTVGFNCERFKVNNGPARGHTFVMWDVGGQESSRSLWPTYFKNASALIFVIDSSDPRRFEEAKVELDTILLKIHQTKFPVIILANKQDKPEAVGAEEVFKVFGADVKNKCEISAIPCCAVTGEGLEKFFPQVLAAIQGSKK